MTNPLFSIVGIYIDRECMHKKILKEGYYSLNNAYCYDEKNKDIEINPKINPLDVDFWRYDNISISAVVSKNGGGKSSLLEIIYRIINNLGFVCFTDEEKRQLSFVDGIRATLYFVENNDKHRLEINCDTIRYDNVEYDLKTKNAENKIKIVEKLKENFFYTLVENYSFQSFISRDYLDEISNDESKCAVSPASPCWIDNVFHKNDGYQFPIVLNPFRNRGRLDLNTEFDLTSDRLSSILIQEKHNNDLGKGGFKRSHFLEGYELNDIKYEFKEETVLNTYPTLDSSSFECGNLFAKAGRTKPNETKYGSFNASINDRNKNSVAYIISHKYFTNIDDILSRFNGILSPQKQDLYEMLLISFMYLVRKTLKIAKQYQPYKDGYFNKNEETKRYIESIDYIDMEKNNKVYEHKKTFYARKVEDAIKRQAIENLVDEILKDPSHIAFKIKRVINCINKLLSLNECPRKITYKLFYEDKFTEYNNLDMTIKCLPPWFFEPDIYLDKTDKTNIKPIRFHALSSGERQFIYAMTTIVYHIKNLISVNDEVNIKYKKFNIMLDEIEICFHPEYQRTFINELLKTIKRLGLNLEHKINIIFSTHSPFILSDIPKQNILFLEKGTYVPEELKPIQTFAANISDILKDSFFLEKGFLGEFATQNIKYVIDKIKDKESISKKEHETYKHFINLIGEPLIRNKLFMMLDDIYYKDDKQKILESKRQRLQNELDNINSKIEKEKNKTEVNK